MTRLRAALASFLVLLGVVAADINFNESRAVLKAVASTSLANATLSSPTFTGVAAFAAGTSAAPALYFSSDTGTGFFRNAGNAISWTFSGSGGGYTFNSSQMRYGSGVALGWAPAADTANNAGDVLMARGGANQMIFGGASAAAGAVTSRTEGNKAVTAFSNGVAKSVLTVTIPNAQHSAVLEVEVQGAIGTGGAIGAGEAVATNTYKFNITRTAGVNAVVVASSAYGAAAAAVAGATTVTATAAASSVSGAVGATNTFTVDVTITRGGGSSDNHTALIYYKLMNANTTGITVQ